MTNHWKKYKRWFIRHPSVLGLIQWTKTHSLPGFVGIPIYSVFLFVWNEAKEERLNLRANSIAFNFFLAIFPFTLFLLTLISFLPLEDVESYIVAWHNSIRNVLPQDVDTFLFSDVIKGIFDLHRGDLLSVGFILAILFASEGMLSMLHGFEKDYTHAFKSRTIIHKRLVALALTGSSGILLTLSFIVVGFGNTVVSELVDRPGMGWLTRWGLYGIHWLVTLSLVWLLVSIIYRYGTPTRQKLSLFAPGTNVATFTIVIFSFLISYFFNRFGTYNKVYGSIGAIIVTMLWIKYLVLILLIGFELNASIATLATPASGMSKPENLIDPKPGQ